MRTLLLTGTLLLPFLLLGQTPTKQELKVRSQLAKGKAYPAIRNATAMLLKGGHPEFYALRAQAYNRIDEHAKAEADARASLQLLPTAPEGLFQLALAEKGMGSLDSAALHLHQLLQRQPGQEARYQLALVQQAQRRPAQAMASIDQTMAAGAGKNGPATARLHRVKGELAAMLGDTAMARAELDRAVALAPDDPVNYNSRGYYAHAWNGDHQGALADYDRAIKLNPNYSYAFNNRGWSRYQLGEVGKGIKDIERAKRRKAQNPYIYRNLGVIALETGDTTQACTCFRQALDEGFTALYGPEVATRMAAHCGNKGQPPAPQVPEQQRTDQPKKETTVPRTNAPE
ncbi:MAG: tetratricopeptide repeat protein [Flavobacteriales bacterium]|nr:tetratricopeptide repeat protein [Flavobacteriales bacterium]